MKKLLVLILFPIATFAQNGVDVIQKFVKAIGANDTTANITSYKYNRSYVANANTDYDEEVVVLGPTNQLSRKKTLLKRDFFYVLNDKSGWVKIPTGSLTQKVTYSTKDLSSSEMAELSNEVKDGIFPFINYDKKGYKLAAPVSTVTIDKKPYSLISLTRGDTKRDYYFDNETGLLFREVLTENKVTHTYDHTKYELTAKNIKLPVSSTYTNSRDKRKTNVTTKWSFEKPGQGVSFVK